jgi:hypothetical protein
METRKYLFETRWKQFLAEQKSMADPYRGAVEQYRDTVLSLLDKFNSNETELLKSDFEKHIDDMLNNMSADTLGNFFRNMPNWNWMSVSRLIPGKLSPIFDNNRHLSGMYTGMYKLVTELIRLIMRSELNAPPVDDSGAVNKSNNSGKAMKTSQELQTLCDAFVKEVDKALKNPYK